MLNDFQQILHVRCLQMYVVSVPFELLLNFPQTFSKLIPAFGQASDPWCWNWNDSQNCLWRLYETDHIRTNVVEVEVLNLSRVRCFTTGLCSIIHISSIALWKPHRSCFLLIINLGLLSSLQSMEWSSGPYSTSSQGHSPSFSFWSFQCYQRQQ